MDGIRALCHQFQEATRSIFQFLPIGQGACGAARLPGGATSKLVKPAQPSQPLAHRLAEESAAGLGRQRRRLERRHRSLASTCILCPTPAIIQRPAYAFRAALMYFRAREEVFTLRHDGQDTILNSRITLTFVRCQRCHSRDPHEPGTPYRRALWGNRLYFKDIPPPGFPVVGMKRWRGALRQDGVEFVDYIDPSAPKVRGL